MHISVRRSIFALFVLTFVVTAPLAVLYTAGYRLNISNRHVQQTGVLAVATLPRGASIILNGQNLAQKTPYVVQRIMPNTHEITLQKKGYHNWSQRVRVDEGKTSYITTRLFADSEPVRLDETQATLVLRSRDLDTPASNDQASVSLFDNGANIEVRAGVATTDPLVGLLPRDEYQLLVDDNEYIILTNARRLAFVIARQGGAVVELPTPLTSHDWLDDKDLLLWSDGAEVNTYDATTNEQTFITREGQTVVDVAWHPEADSFFVASATTLNAYDLTVYETREVITLLSDATIADIWLDTSGKNLYYLETIFNEDLANPVEVNQLVLVL